MPNITSKHVTDKGQVLHVDDPGKAVYVELPDGKLRYSGAPYEPTKALAEYVIPTITDKRIAADGKILHVDDKAKAVYTQSADGSYVPVPLAPPTVPVPEVTYEQAKALPPAPAAAPVAAEKDTDKVITPAAKDAAPTAPAKPLFDAKPDDKTDTSKKS